MKQKLISTMNTMKWFYVILVLVIVLAGCTPAMVSPNSAAADPQMLLIPRWFLESMTVEGKPVDVPAQQQQMTIQFQGKNDVSGTGPCNSFGGTYQAATDGRLSFSPLAATLMACDNGMDMESAYFNGLSQVKLYKFDQGKLILFSEDGKTSLTFRKPPK